MLITDADANVCAPERERAVILPKPKKRKFIHHKVYQTVYGETLLLHVKQAETGTLMTGFHTGGVITMT